MKRVRSDDTRQYRATSGSRNGSGIGGAILSSNIGLLAGEVAGTALTVDHSEFVENHSTGGAGAGGSAGQIGGRGGNGSSAGIFNDLACPADHKALCSDILDKKALLKKQSEKVSNVVCVGVM